MSINTNDACEWNPATNQLALTTDPVHAQAEVMVGADVAYRPCAPCAALPRFRRYRTRRPIVRRTPPESAKP